MKQVVQAPPRSRKDFAGLTLAAMGVVFGDIGTSPLYTLQTCLSANYGLSPSPANVMGLLSLITWLLILVVSIKYALFIMRSDNHGEGGILALLALTSRTRISPRSRWLFGLLGVFGAALFYGDGMITPAISVLSAVEGLEIAEPSLKAYVIPVTIGVLIVLFLIQRKGTARIGGLFGPVMAIWFCCIALLGMNALAHAPQVIHALNPVYGIDFFLAHRWQAFILLGAVVLAVTGAEALYADMGHFGRQPVCAAWFWFVFPALLLNYYGQGALVLTHAAADNPFFKLAPDWGLYPLVILATLATVIASQAVISGAFSVSRQAVQLHYLPRMEIRHTSDKEIGQIYVPFINWVLLMAVVALVMGFGSSTALASAYGIAVTGTMICTSILALAIARKRWKWNWPATLAAGAFFMTIDGALFGANLLKISQGGWFPLTIGLVVFMMMSTWSRGRKLLAEQIKTGALPIEAFLADLVVNPPETVPGTAVFMTSNLQIVPQALLHNLKHNKVIHEQVILIQALSKNIPYISADERIELVGLSKNLYRIRAWYGFQESPNIPDLLMHCQGLGLHLNLMETSFFLSSETIVHRPVTQSVTLWRGKLFSWMARNTMSAAKFFNLPINRVIVLGGQVEI